MYELKENLRIEEGKNCPCDYKQGEFFNRTFVTRDEEGNPFVGIVRLNKGGWDQEVVIPLNTFENKFERLEK